MLPAANHQSETDVAHQALPPRLEGGEAEATEGAEPTTAYTNNGAIPPPQQFAAGAPPATAGDKAFAATDHLRPDQRAYYEQIRTREPGIADKRAQQLAGESRPLTQNDRATVTAIQRKLATMKPKRIDAPKNPNLVQIEVAFDGTGDDRETMTNDTNPAILEDAFEGPKQYQPGIATQRGKGFVPAVANNFQFATGAGMQDRIDAAYTNLVAEVNSPPGGNPKAVVVLVVVEAARWDVQGALRHAARRRDGVVRYRRDVGEPQPRHGHPGERRQRPPHHCTRRAPHRFPAAESDRSETSR